VEEALDALPAYIHERMENVAVVVEERAEREKLGRLGYDPDVDLLGLYEGVPRTVRANGYNFAVPDRITLFREAILEEAGPGGDDAVVREIRKTIIHEIGHHFGLGDPEIEHLEGAPRQDARHGR
jgi:predicted Zn-dependent protease with MMP-like domain